MNEFNTFSNDLLGINVNIEEGEQTTLLLCFMSNFLDNLITSMNHLIKLDMNSVVASLLWEELRRKSLETTTSSFGFQAFIS